MQSSDHHAPYYDTRMPEPEIPMRSTPWFMKALWALAAMLVIGIAFSFWRISSVEQPRLDLPPVGPSTDTARRN